MRGLTKDEKRSTLGSFLDTEETSLEVVDRSTLEAWSECPWRAKAQEQGRVKLVGMAAEVGEAIHQALAAVTLLYVQDEGEQFDQSPYAIRSDLRINLEQELRRVRPDLQPEALARMMPSAFAWCDYLARINPGNILAFDGGDECGRSSQYAYDFPDLGTRVTSELDLVTANPTTVEIIDWSDYKTGRERFTEDEIAQRFQFQMHGMLLLHHFPDAQAARLRIWETWHNKVSYTVTFPRSRFNDYLHRVRSAAEVRRRHFDSPPCWPYLEKCEVCPAAAICPVADEPLLELSDEVTLAKKFAAVESKRDGLRRILAAYVDTFGREISLGEIDGKPMMFGRQGPKQQRKAEAKLYSPKGKKKDDSDSNEAP